MNGCKESYFNVSSTNSACDKTYLKEADDFALMLIQVNFIANKVINHERSKDCIVLNFRLLINQNAKNDIAGTAILV